MTATLDTQNHYGDLTGGVSDPRLIRRLGEIIPPSPQDIALTQRAILRAHPSHSPHDATMRALLADMLGVPTPQPHPSIPRTPGE